MLCRNFDATFLEQHLLPVSRWRPFARAGEREVWQALPEHELNRERKTLLKERAEGYLGRAWPELPASLYAEFARTGDRKGYERPYFERRERLAVLVMAECMEYQGRFLDEIMNGLMLIVQEFTWTLPAHAWRHENDILQREDEPVLALFSCQTACTLAEAVYLLEPELRALSPTLVRRINREILERVVEPAETDVGRYHWSKGLNNWTPWCCSSILGAAMHVMEDTRRLARLIAGQLNPCIDRFLEKYPQDGCCDEGPVYWNVSPGAMLVYLEYLYERTSGVLSVYDEPFIRRMGEYIVDAHLDGPWFSNFADASPLVRNFRRGVIYRYGERVGSDSMQQLVLNQMRQWRSGEDARVSPVFGSSGSGNGIGNMLRELFWIPVSASAGELRKRVTAWYPRAQVLFARETDEPGRGLVLAAKAGHNAENHNHNDVGQFILLKDSQPFIVDPGVGVYSRTTFSDERYTLWYMRSSAHNLPLINGAEQNPGHEFRASAVSFSVDDDRCEQALSMDLAGAYPGLEGLHACHRTLVLGPGGMLLRDEIDAQSPVELRLHLLTPASVNLHAGQSCCELERNGVGLRITWQPGIFADVFAEEQPLADPRLRDSWGERLIRIVLVAAPGRADSGYWLRMG